MPYAALLRPTAAISVFPQTLVGEISIHRHPKSKNAISIYSGSSFNRRCFFGRMYSSFDLTKSATIITRCCSDQNFNGVEEETAILEDNNNSNRGSWKMASAALQGFESTVNRKSKWLFAGGLSLVILWKHDAEVLWVAMGTVVNFWLSIGLKRMINQERPSALRSDPGMPSSHAQFLFFAVVSALLPLMKWMKINILSVAIGTFTLICGSYLSWLRVSQGMHTINQVLAGAAVGSVFGMTWFWLWHEFVLEAFISSNWVQQTVAVASVVFCIIYSIQSRLRRDE